LKDYTEQFREAVTRARDTDSTLHISGGGTKDFLGRPVDATESLDVTAHQGIVNYHPSELVVTVRAGTLLCELQAELAENGQKLAFEPPAFGPGATIGGAVAAGLSGPARPWTGAVRDFVLGCRIINGRGQVLRFGGEVMKNVAGYDLSRLMAGAWGTLGILLDVSMKVLPIPRAGRTLMHECSLEEAIAGFNRWSARPWPISAAWWADGRSCLRLSGAESSVDAVVRELGGEELENDTAFWDSVRELKHSFFGGDAPLWRLSLAPASPPLELDGPTALDWGGAQRWLRSRLRAEEIRSAVARMGGHAICYASGEGSSFHPLSADVLKLHQRLKKSLDPAGLFNPGRMYAEL